MKQKILGTLALLLSILLTKLVYAQGSASDPSEPPELPGKEFTCVLALGDREEQSCRVSVVSQDVVISLKYQTIRVPIRHIFSLNSQVFKVARGRDYGYIYFGFITEPKTRANRTNFLHASTKYEQEVVSLHQQIIDQLRNSSGVSFSEIVPLQTSSASEQTASSEQINHLLKTKTCIRCDLRSVNLASANLFDANLEGANLQGANLSRANLENAYLVGAILDGANLTNAKLNQAKLIRTSMLNVNLERSQLQSANLQRANLANAVLRNAQLSSSGDRKTDLRFVNLSNADLSGAGIEGVDLVGANLQDANLKGANLSDKKEEVWTDSGYIFIYPVTNLSYANLSGANLSNANLKNAILYQANLCRATMPDGTVSNQGCQR
ncbi:pentapeptide repeat-containing protein [Microseira wollei]|uniref:Pentapeptide repeat protein n=1 Tax=Microseira wollei NIES-4236 TaxID=2530354 RepID=A0AAV3X622_9CYAN|nr:pentapeptide repeat-containing protein [Microseira wollei]GET36726.1 pentapeptide repeat protein [Microseira wollei NIES-4236]